jgi:hypothetical protein
VDAMVDEGNCVFFLPHHPRGEICEPPFFLFMKGTGVLQIMNFSLISSANHYIVDCKTCISLYSCVFLLLCIT